MPLVNREKLTISLLPETKRWLENQSAKECRPIGRMVEWLILEYKKEIEPDKEKTD